MSEIEVELSGGNINPAILKVGDTVRRRMTSASPAVHQLLQHLEKVGFRGSPRFLGVDPQGREMLTYIEGQTGVPENIWQEDQPLISAAKILRSFHEAVADFKPSGSLDWAYSDPDPQRHEVICHNDFAPYNFVYVDGIPIAVIDFDLAGPGPLLKDIAYAAYWMVPLSFNSPDQIPYAQADLHDGSRRLRLFCQTYGVQPEGYLLDMIVEVLDFMGNEDKMHQIVGESATSKLIKNGHLAHWQREAIAFQVYRSQLKKNLLK